MKNGFLFKDLKKTLITRYGKDTAEKIWKKAELEYKRFDQMLPDVKGDGQMMLPVAAYYSALREYDAKNALSLLVEYGTQTGIKLKKLIHGLTSIPGVSALLWRNMYAQCLLRRAGNVVTTAFHLMRIRNKQTY